MKYKYLTLNFKTLKPSNEFLPGRTMQSLVHVLWNATNHYLIITPCDEAGHNSLVNFSDYNCVTRSTSMTVLVCLYPWYFPSYNAHGADILSWYMNDINLPLLSFVNIGNTQVGEIFPPRGNQAFVNHDGSWLFITWWRQESKRQQLWYWVSLMGVFRFSDRTQIAKFMRPTWGPPGSRRPQMGPILVPWT